MAAGAVVITETTHTSVKRIKFAWTSGTGAEGGTAAGTTVGAYDGTVLLLTTDPGTAAPTDNYDMTITDADGVDVLAGAGANRDTANTEQVIASSLAAVAGSKLTLNITNAGDAKEGVVYLYVR